MSMPPRSGKPRVVVLEDLVGRDNDHDWGSLGVEQVCVQVDGVADQPSRFDKFRILASWNNRDGKEHIAMVRGDVAGAEDLPMRLHSKCLTGAYSVL